MCKDDIIYIKNVTISAETQFHPRLETCTVLASLPLSGDAFTAALMRWVCATCLLEIWLWDVLDELRCRLKRICRERCVMSNLFDTSHFHKADMSLKSTTVTRCTGNGFPKRFRTHYKNVRAQGRKPGHTVLYDGKWTVVVRHHMPFVNSTKDLVPFNRAFGLLYRILAENERSENNLWYMALCGLLFSKTYQDMQSLRMTPHASDLDLVMAVISRSLMMSPPLAN